MTTATAERIELVESFSIDPTQLREGKDGSFIKELPDGRFRVRCKGQHCGIVNRNNRIYPAESTWGPHTRAESPFMRRVSARRVTGQLEHPPDGKSSMGLAAVVVTEVSAPDKDGVVMVTFETMSTEHGRVVESYIRDGVGFGLSSRGNGSVRRNGKGVDEVQGDFEPITFDTVIDESTPGAEVVARSLREARQRLMESAGGDEVRARALADRQTEEAIRRDVLALQRANTMESERLHETASPPTGDNEYLLGLGDGTGHYRAFLNGRNQWDVWLMLHNLAPEQVAADMPTVRDAKEVAERHSAKIMRESYTVDAAMPFAGTMLTLRLDSESEAKQAMASLEKAGFNAHRRGDDAVCVYTSYEDPAQAEAHILRVLSDKNIEPRDESFGVIRRGRIVWEDTMADTDLLRDIKNQLDALTERGTAYERGMSYEDDDDLEIVGMDMDDDDDEFYEDEDPHAAAVARMPGDLEGGEEEPSAVALARKQNEQDDDDDEDYYDDEDEDEDYYDDEDEDEEMEEARPYGKKRGRREGRYEGDDGMYDDPDVTIDGSPEDEMDPDRMPESAVRFVDLPRKQLGETIGLTRVFLDENDEVVKVQQLTEQPASRAAQKAMFAKAYGTDDRAQKARSGTAKKQRKGGTNDYYRKFRKKGAKKKGQNQNLARKNIRRVKKGKRGESVQRRDDDGREQLTERPRKRVAKRLVEATVTLLASPHHQDVMTGLRVVMEAAADWPEPAKVCVLEALAELHRKAEDEGLVTVVESAAEHVLGEPLHEEQEQVEETEPRRPREPRHERQEPHRPAQPTADPQEVTALKAENARLTELVNALTELNTAQAVEAKVNELCVKHPALERVRSKLENCAVVAEADTYLALLGESANTPANQGGQPAAARSGAPALTLHDGGQSPAGAGFSTTSVPSNGGGSLSGPLEESYKPPLGGRNKPKMVESTSSRVASYRKRQQNRRG